LEIKKQTSPADDDSYVTRLLHFCFLLFVPLLRSKISFVALLLCYVFVCLSLMDLCRRPMSVMGDVGGP